MKDSQKSKKKKFKRSLLLLILPISLLGLTFFCFYYNTQIAADIAATKLNRTPFASLPLSPYPLFTNPNIPYISATSAIVMDKDTKVILYQKNMHVRFFPASTTKLMSVLTSLSYYHLQDALSIQSASAEGSVVGFSYGERVSFEDLLYGMLLPSGNDAAIALAENYPGGMSQFVAKMNENAKNLRLLDTHFADPAGLSDENNYMTAYDLAILASEVLKNPVISKIVGTKYKTITNVDGTKKYYLENLNKLLGVEGVNGVKTGYTDKAGQVLVTSKDEKGHALMIVVMKSIDRFSDTKELLDALTNHVTFVSYQAL